MGGEIAALRRRLTEADLYARDRPGFEQAAAALHAAESNLATAEEEWLALELPRESLERV